MTDIDKPINLKKELHSANMMTFSNASLNRGGVVCNASGGWIELGRTELACAADLITVNCLASHESLQVLALTDGVCGNTQQRMFYNNDSCSNYAKRQSTNGGGDVTDTNQSNLLIGCACANPVFTQTFIKNVTGQEKLGITHLVKQTTAGECTAPERRELVSKWDNTCAQITRVDVKHCSSGDFPAGSQVIVLGWDKSNTHDVACNFWKPLGQTTVTCATDNIEVACFAAKEWLMINYYIVPTGGCAARLVTFNNDSCSNYANRRKFMQGACDVTSTNENNTGNLIGSNSSPSYHTLIVRNQSDKEKLGISHNVCRRASGADNVSTGTETVFKWDNTCAQITTVDVTNTLSGDYAAGSFLQVWGSD